MNAHARQLIQAAGRAALTGALLGFIHLLAPASHAANLYKWVDEQGNVTYSQRKPPDRESKSVVLRGVRPADPNAREKLDALQDRLDTTRKDREFAATDAESAREYDRRNEENCEIARQNLRILKTNARVRTKDENGEEQYLDQAGIEAKLQETERQIQELCG